MPSASETRDFDERPEPVPREQVPDVHVYSHSNFFYWWPVWLTGYIMAAVTRLDGKQVTEITGEPEWFHASQAPGLIFTMVLFLVVFFTNVTLRGLASVVTVLSLVLVAVLMAYFDLWQPLLGWLPDLFVHMNMGFYMIFSTLLFVVWLLTFLIFDRLSYWRIRPGQIIHHYVIGGSARSYDTHGMVFEKVREDLFRHWVLGVGSGDLRVHTMGAKQEEIFIPNVLFVDAKVRTIHRMIAVRPEEFRGPGV